MRRELHGVLEEGDYILRVGTSSRDTKAEAILRLEKELVVEQLKNLMTADGIIEELVPESIGPVYEGEVPADRIIGDRSVGYRCKTDRLSGDYG